MLHGGYPINVILLQFLVRFGTQINQITLKSHKEIIPIAQLISKHI